MVTTTMMSNTVFALILQGLVIFLLSKTGFSQAGSGLKISAAADLVGEFGVSKDSSASNKFEARGIEITAFGPVDHLFDARIGIAAHPEGGEVLAELHEAYIESSKLIPNSRFRIGQFFLGIGRLNTIHQHDRPFIGTPYIHSHVFNDDEGALDAGIEYSILIPTSFFLDFTFGVTNGFSYGHSHDAGQQPDKPTHYAHLKSYFSLGEFGFQPGVSYLRRKDATGNQMTLYGANLTGKKREGRILRWLIESEFWHRSYEPEGATSSSETEKTYGFYVYPQYGFSSIWSLGVRGDYFTVDSLETLSGDKVKNHRLALETNVSYRASEFSKISLAHTFEEVQENEDQKSSQNFFSLQTTFVLGAHPAHEF